MIIWICSAVIYFIIAFWVFFAIRERGDSLKLHAQLLFAAAFWPISILFVALMSRYSDTPLEGRRS